MTSSARRVRRIIRKIDPWTVLKVSFVFQAVVALAIVLGAVILWSVVVARGIPQEIDGLLQQLRLINEGETLFQSGEEYFRLVVFLAVVGTVVMTGITTLAAVMYNLIADVVGGVEVVVLEETLNVPVAVLPSRTAAAVGSGGTGAHSPELRPRSDGVGRPSQSAGLARRLSTNSGRASQMRRLGAPSPGHGGGRSR